MFDNEEVPVRGPVHIAVADPVSEKDENDYSTLKQVKRDIDSAVVQLYQDFNAFSLAKDAPDLAVQVEGRQLAYQILLPLQAQIHQAVSDINEKYKG